MDGDKELPLVIDEAAAGNNNDDDNDNMIEEITEEIMTEQPTAAAAAAAATATATAATTNDKTIDLVLDEPPTRPARVSIEPSRSILRNPYRRRGRKEAQTRTTTTTEQPTATATATATTDNFDMTTSAQEYIEKIYNNANHFNTFGEKGEEYALAETITRKYSKMKNSTHNRFHKIVQDATDPTTNNPGDAVLHEMITKEVRMKNHLEVDYLFYYNISGPPNMHKRTILDQALKIWTTRIANDKDGKPLNTTTHGVYVRQLFLAFHARDVHFAAADFNFQGEFKGVLQKDWNNKREADPMIGTKRTKAEFNEFVDEKFAKVVTDGVYKPFNDMHDLLKLLTMELGPLKYAIVAPGGGSDKAHKLSLDNPLVTKQFLMVVEDTSNPFCVIKLISFYRERCKPDQSRFFCHVNNGRKKGSVYYFKPRSPVGQDSLRKWVKEFAEVTDFKDWEKYTPHDNRHDRCCTILASDLVVPEKVRMNHLRHKSAKLSNPYIHQNSKSQAAVQGVLSASLHEPKKEVIVLDGKNLPTPTPVCNNKNPTPAPSKVTVHVDTIAEDKENTSNPPAPRPQVSLGLEKRSPSKDL
eukprot:jgi/Psemu1/42729/gm1.42729_g